MARDVEEQPDAGVPRLDEERRELQHHLAILREALVAGSREVALGELQALAASLPGHFEEEEQWMAAEGYTERAAHARAHAAGVEVFRRAATEYGRAGVAARFLVERAVAWLEVHLRRDDVRFGRFLQERGAPDLPRGG